MLYKYLDVLKNFNIEGEVVYCVQHGSGHINETFLVKVDNNGKITNYIFQKINAPLFKNMEGLMNNIELVTEFIGKKLDEVGYDKMIKCLNIVKTKDGKLYYYDKQKDGYFRVFYNIEGGVAYDIVDNPEHFYQAGRGFGKFAYYLNDFDASKLYPILPNFHNTVVRYTDFINAVNLDKFDRAKNVEKEIKFVKDREKYCSVILDLLNSGKMPLRVTHNDTKLNNVLISKSTEKYLAVIDLDTIMPGSLCYDFGDAIRAGCNTAMEDEVDLNKVKFDINLFEYFVKGYLKSLSSTVTQIEKDNFAFSAILMTYECGMRFLTDYLNGDTYFRIARENHNLDRARTQFKLIIEMEKNLEKMKEIVNKY